MQEETTPIFKRLWYDWTQQQPGIEPTNPLGQCWVPPIVAFYDQQGLLRTYSLPGSSIRSPHPGSPRGHTIATLIAGLQILTREGVWGGGGGGGGGGRSNVRHMLMIANVPCRYVFFGFFLGHSQNSQMLSAEFKERPMYRNIGQFFSHVTVVFRLKM